MTEIIEYDDFDQCDGFFYSNSGIINLGLVRVSLCKSGMHDC
jgi:hypothetical protein